MHRRPQRRASYDAQFEAFARRSRSRLTRFAQVLTGNWADAEDLTAEALARSWAAMRRRPLDGIEPYVLRTMVNLAIKRERRRAVETRHAPVRPDDWRVVDPSYDDSHDGLARDEIKAMVAALPIEERAVMMMRFVLDMSEAQTASALGIPPGTVKSRVSRAVHRLRRIRLAQPPPL